MMNVEFFERFWGAFLLWLIALIASLYSFLLSMPLYIEISLGSTGLFLVFFLTWGLIYSLLYTLLALYFRVSDHIFGTDVPQPSHSVRKKKGK